MKIACISPDSIDATSIYRAVGPMMRLPKEYEVQISSQRTGFCIWHVLQWADVVFMQRPWAQDQIAFCANIKHMNKKLWLDWDDDLTVVPPYNLAYNSFKGCEENIRTLCQMADVISVTTPALADKCFKLGATNVHIIPNAIDDNYFLPVAPRGKAVVWRGGNSHIADLEIYRPVAHALASSGLQQIFIGEPPHWGWEVPHIQMPIFEYTSFMRTVHDIAPAVCVVPLVDNDFNRSKSLIAGMEAALMGAQVVCSPVGEYAHVNCFRRASTTDDWVLRINQALVDPLDTRAWVESYRLSSVNDQRIALLQQLVEL